MASGFTVNISECDMNQNDRFSSRLPALYILKPVSLDFPGQADRCNSWNETKVTWFELFRTGFHIYFESVKWLNV